MSYRRTLTPILAVAVTFGTLIIEPTQGQYATSGLLLLKDGQVLPGTIHEVPGGYGIQSKSGFQVILNEKIDLVASSLKDAYEQKRKRLLKPSYEDHMTLARWCLQFNLLEEAQFEVESANRLVAATQFTHPPDSTANNRTTEGARIMETPNGFVAREPRSSNGLLHSSQRDFIRRIQPLLINKCGNANCHGEAAENDFNLELIRLGTAGNRLQNHANLVEVIDQITFDTPDSSPLLQRPQASSHPQVFTGPRGQNQFDILRDWVLDVTRTSQIDHRKLRQSPVPAAASFIRFEPQVEQAAHQDQTLVQENIEPRRIDHSMGNPRRIDPFDPEQFNRRIHGATAEELRTRPRETEANPLNPSSTRN